MFNRIIFKHLEKWSVSKNRKPLILCGARQVGKTTLVLAFAKKYQQFIHLNLENKEHKKLFESQLDFNTLLDAIFFQAKKQKGINPTLVFIDEIQNSGEAIKLLRYFYENVPEMHVIAAGSLLETILNRKISFPVGRVEYLSLRPCSFIEYLNAIGENRLVQLINQLDVPEYAHEIINKHFHRYTVIGGMPEIIQQYVETNDITSLQNVYQSLLAGYMDDVEKYASNQMGVQYIRHILKVGLSYAGQRIKFERFGGSDYRSREMGEAFRVLEKAMLTELIYPVSNTSLPLIANYRKSPRFYWLDIGLVNYAANIQYEVFSNTDFSTVWKGITAELIVGQELLAYDTNVLSKRYFWTREEKNSTAEIDFVIPFKGNLIPIEVKSGNKGRLRSMHLFIESAPHSIAIRVWSNKFSVDEVVTPKGKNFKLINIPFYLVSNIHAILSKYV